MTKISFIGDSRFRSHRGQSTESLVDLVLQHTGYELAVEGRAGGEIADIHRDLKQALEQDSTWIILFHTAQNGMDATVYREYQTRWLELLGQYPYAQCLHCMDSASDNIENLLHTNTDILSMWSNPRRRLLVPAEDSANLLCYAGNVQAAKQIISWIDSVKDLVV